MTRVVCPKEALRKAVAPLGGPWSIGELADYLHSSFDKELQARRRLIAFSARAADAGQEAQILDIPKPDEPTPPTSYVRSDGRDAGSVARGRRRVPEHVEQSMGRPVGRLRSRLSRSLRRGLLCHGLLRPGACCDGRQRHQHNQQAPHGSVDLHALHGLHLLATRIREWARRFLQRALPHESRVSHAVSNMAMAFSSFTSQCSSVVEPIM